MTVMGIVYISRISCHFQIATAPSCTNRKLCICCWLKKLQYNNDCNDCGKLCNFSKTLGASINLLPPQSHPQHIDLFLQFSSCSSCSPHDATISFYLIIFRPYESFIGINTSPFPVGLWSCGLATDWRKRPVTLGHQRCAASEGSKQWNEGRNGWKTHCHVTCHVFSCISQPTIHQKVSCIYV